MTFPGGETVTLTRRELSPTPDEFGNDVYTPTPVAVAGCVVWPRTSSEDTNAADTITTGLTVLLPPGTDATAVDAVTVRGATYEIDGEPGVFRSPFTSTDPGVLINLTRVTG